MSERLREQLQERLMLALDFATLGAYELTAPEGDAALADSPDEPVERERVERRGPPQRVFLFAKAAPACPQSAPSSAGRCGAAADMSLRGAHGARRGRRRRAGMARAAEQPCTWG